MRYLEGMDPSDPTLPGTVDPGTTDPGTFDTSTERDDHDPGDSD
jgi:hypothetical protein